MKEKMRNDLIDSTLVGVGIPAYVIGIDAISAAKEAGGLNSDIIKDAVSKTNPKTLIMAGCAAGTAFYLGKLITRQISEPSR